MTLKTASHALTAFVTFCVLVAHASAQQNRDESNSNRQAEVGTKGAGDTGAIRDAKPTPCVLHRASEIQGMKVKNNADKELGTIKDIVIDLRKGQVTYAAISYGGLLGFGDKLFAVPWHAFHQRHDSRTNTHTLVLSIDATTLKGAPGFDQNKWPNFADSSLTKEYEKHYGKARQKGDGQASVDVTAGSVTVDIDLPAEHKRADQDRKDNAEPATAKSLVDRASQIHGTNVKSATGMDLGAVSDLVIEMNSGNVRYVALSHSPVAETGDKLFVVPWNLFTCEYDLNDQKYGFVLAIDASALREAPAFDSNAWPDLADSHRCDAIDKYYEQARSNAPKQR